MSTGIIQLKQKPVIEYSVINKRSEEVKKEIAALNINEIQPTEENRKEMKKLRARLNKELSVFEEQRKMIKSLIMAPYDDFNSEYTNKIKSVYSRATDALKEKIASAEAEMTDRIRAELNDHLAAKLNDHLAAKLNDHLAQVCGHDFVTLDDVGVKVTLSASMQAMKKEIDRYVSAVNDAVSSIKTMDNGARILVKYQKNKDLAASIAEVNSEIKREKEIEAQREKEIEAQREKEIDEPIEPVSTAEPQQANEEAHSMTFTVTGTIEQLRKIKQFMESIGVSYE